MAFTIKWRNRLNMAYYRITGHMAELLSTGLNNSLAYGRHYETESVSSNDGDY